jgi:hypothetical protein
MESYDSGAGGAERARQRQGGDDAGPGGPEADRAGPAPERAPAPGPTAPVAAEPGSPEPDGAAPGGTGRVPGSPPRPGIAGLTPGRQLAALLALALVVAAAGLHLGLVFLHVAPSNTLTKEHGETVDAWVLPEFEQNWKLFAPNPLQQNVAVQARAELRGADGEPRATGWHDLSAQDGRAIDGNPVPSHTQQNQLRRAWDFFASTHDAQNQPNGMRGTLSERYLRRIVVMRLDGLEDGALERVQVRVSTTNVAPPRWSKEIIDTNPVFRQLPWWPVTEDDRPLDAAGDPRARDDRTEAAR